MIKPKLIIFARAPLMGKAKTRLARDIGPVHAKRLYQAMTAKVLRQVKSPKWETVLAITPENWIGRVPVWHGTEQYAQTSGSLSPRLAQAFRGRGPICVIGTDCPQVTSKDINDAFLKLRKNRVVFGPADDGGFWLMAMRGPIKSDVFENIRWSSQYALADVAKNINGPSAYLRELIDVDDAKALAAVRAQLD